MTIAFDVDGTLVTYNDKPRWDILSMLRCLSNKHTIIVWSGGGKEYAEMWVRKLMIEDYVNSCRSKPMGKIFPDEIDVDICFDDEMVELAKMNVRV